MDTVLCRPDGTVQEGWRGPVERRRAPLDPSLIVLLVPELPRDLTAWRWDGKDGLRAETDAERGTRETAATERAARQALADTRAAEAVLTVLAKRLSLDPTTLRDEVVTELIQTARVPVAAPPVGRAGG